MATYRIVEWDERYEVDDKGREWEAGKTKRKTALAFVRLAVHGKSLGHGYRKMQRRAGKRRTLMVFGFFAKLLEIAADGDREQRNLLPSDQEIAEIIEAPLSQVEFAISVLLDCGWVQKLEDCSTKLPEAPGSSPLINKPNQPNLTEQTPPISPPGDEGEPEPPRRFLKPAPEDVTEYAGSIGFELDGQEFVDFYTSKGWKVGRTPMKDWRACVRTWKRKREQDRQISAPPPAATPQGALDLMDEVFGPVKDGNNG